MEMDLVEIVEPTGVATFKCLDFREACAKRSEGPVRTRTQSPRLAPQRRPTHFSQEDCALPRETFKYQGEEMKQRTNHLVTALSVSFCPSLSPYSFSSPSLSFALLSLLSPLSIFVCLFPWLHLLLFDLPLPLFTFPAVCGCAEIEDSLKCVRHCQGSGEGRGGVRERGACIWLMARSGQGSSHIMNAESLPDPSQCGTGSQTLKLSGLMKDLDLDYMGSTLCSRICFLTRGQRSVQSPS